MVIPEQGLKIAGAGGCGPERNQKITQRKSGEGTEIHRETSEKLCGPL